MRRTNTEMLHWSQRHVLKDPKITIRTSHLVSESLEDSAALTLFEALSSGKAPSDLQSKFDASVKKLIKDFMAQAPGYEFKIGGRQPTGNRKKSYQSKLQAKGSSEKKSKAKKAKPAKAKKSKAPVETASE